ncbi:hypothetical protein SDJN02_22770, partial [Cucurbita argyrosperma subsp. argyrosperma]
MSSKLSSYIIVSSARRSRIKKVRDGLENSLKQRIELIESYARISSMIEIEVEMESDVIAAEAASSVERVSEQIEQIMVLENLEESLPGGIPTGLTFNHFHPHEMEITSRTNDMKPKDFSTNQCQQRKRLKQACAHVFNPVTFTTSSPHRLVPSLLTQTCNLSNQSRSMDTSITSPDTSQTFSLVKMFNQSLLGACT